LLAPRLAPHAELTHAALAGPAAATFATLEPALCAADALVFATGTHWDSWSSPLQKFLEDATPAEAGPLWLGKPAAVLVTEHSVGGKAVLSRLQGVLLTLGCSLPPLSGLVLSQAVQLARRHTPDPALADDFWSPDDLDVIAHNLLTAARQPRPAWRAWPVDRQHFSRPWLTSDPG
jgi:chromate reductase